MAVTIFYDGKCSLCAKEINHYKRIAPAGTFVYEDITQSENALNASGISLKDGLKWLHAQDDNGKLHIGVDAAILIWSQLKRWKLLAQFISLPMMYSIAGWCYKQFAEWRFKRLTHCQVLSD